MSEKEIKKEIRQLKKLKLQCKSGSEERLALHRKIKELKAQLEKNAEGNIEKDPIIKEILKRDTMFEKLGIDLYKFDVKQLQQHLNRIKEELNEKSKE